MKPLRAAALLLVVTACSDRDAVPPPHRIRLFDRMDRATLELPPTSGVRSAPETVAAFDFDGGRPDRVWRSVGAEGDEFLDADDGGIEIATGAGVAGGALSVGPLAAGEAGAAVVLLPARGLARVEVEGRVRLLSNARGGSASTREALRVLEHRVEADAPGGVAPWLRRTAPVHRVSRRTDPSGWDRFSVSFVTRPDTLVLELRLNHRDDGSGASITRFDDVTVRRTPLVGGELWDHLRERHAPRDGQEESTPWRIRPALPRPLVRDEEVRDAVLLPPPATLSFPVTLPPAEIAPRLRFQVGMLPEAFGAPGDGARVVVRFRPDGGDAIEVGGVTIDPKRNEEERSWRPVTLDLTALGGRSGVLSFESRDVDGEGPDPLDAVVLATPRIEPAAATPDAWNVLLIGVDTLRADRLSALGYGRRTTPHLERLFERGVRFRNAR
ncbi:MAG: sulfatase-like hydrolase/transferase, partial [Planctomycetota bacterium JB042]